MTGDSPVLVNGASVGLKGGVGVFVNYTNGGLVSRVFDPFGWLKKQASRYLDWQQKRKSLTY